MTKLKTRVFIKEFDDAFVKKRIDLKRGDETFSLIFMNLNRGISIKSKLGNRRSVTIDVYAQDGNILINFPLVNGHVKKIFEVDSDNEIEKCLLQSLRDSYDEKWVYMNRKIFPLLKKILNEENIKLIMNI